MKPSRSELLGPRSSAFLRPSALGLGICIFVFLASLASPQAASNEPVTFRKLRLSDQFWSEGATIGDFNRDGHADVASGPFWYEGPDFTNRHAIWPATATFKRSKPDGSQETIPGFEGALGVANAYSEAFLMFTYDFNNDGWPDILVIGFPGKPATWYQNPKGADRLWPRHQIFDEVGNESPAFADVTGDGKPELLCCARNCLGYLEPDWKDPAAPWTFHPITPQARYQKFTHGVGCGDINGDGRTDIIEKDGWWEQPASLAGDPVWIKHPFHFADAAAQMLVYDVNGDGLNDVITSLNAHGYGLAWFEQVRTNGDITFVRHLILNPDATPNREGISFTQLHSLALADMDGDGLKDIVTGKRFWAHGKRGADPESDGFPALLYWFQLRRLAGGQAEFIPHLIDNDSGVGTQVTVGSIQNWALPDIVVGNKKGTFVFLRQQSAGGRTDSVEPESRGRQERGSAIRSSDASTDPAEAKSQSDITALIPLKLELPAPVFAGTPKDAPPGVDMEPTPAKPPPSLMIPRDARNVAPGKKITCSDKSVPAPSLERIADGNKEAGENSVVILRKGLQWVQLDLGAPHQVFALALWHAHDTPKVYRSVIIQVADDVDFTENVRTLFNNDRDNSAGLGVGSDRQYFETFMGKTIDAKGARARYVRLYSHGSTESALNEYTEVEIYGRSALTSK